MQSIKTEQTDLEIRHEIERFKEDVASLKAQLAELEQENFRSPLLFQKLGKHFGFGAAGKLDWVGFKLRYKQEELERCKTEQARLDVIANRSKIAPELQSAPPAGFSV
jgi:hypothetical protein